MAVDADLIGRMLVQLQLGTAKADFPGGPLTGDAAELWDLMATEAEAIRAGGGALEPTTPELPDLPPITPADRDAAAQAGGDGGAGRQGTLPEAAGSQDQQAPGGAMPWSVREGFEGCDGWSVVNDDTGRQVAGGCHPTKRDAEGHLRALYAHADDTDLAAADQVEAHFAEVDTSEWDANAAMTACSTGACYASICAGRKAGPPDQRSSWALPHHKTQGGAPNANGVRAALARFSATEGLTNAGAARRHLDAHMATIRGGREEDSAVTDTLTGDTTDTAAATETAGGDPSQGTPADRRKKENKDRVPRRKRGTSASTDSKIEATGDGKVEGILVIEGIPTGDGREFAEGSLDFADLPLPLTYQPPTHGGQPGSAIDVGVITEVWADEDQPRIKRFRGQFDMADEAAADVYRKVASEEKFLRGISVDIDDIDPTTDVELVWPEGMEDLDGAEALFMPPSKRIFHKGRIRGAAVLSMPAFVEAQLWAEGVDPPPVPELVALEASARHAEAELEREEREGRKAMVAAGIVTRLEDRRPERAWFQNPELGMPSPIIVTDDLRVYGHAFTWDQCHIGYAGDCVTPPRETEFPYFTQGSVVCADGSTVAVGPLTLGTGHAPLRGVSARAAAEHYDNTGSVVADVAIGVDRVGAWVAGAIRPGATPEQVYALRASGQLSGDWRSIGGRLRLVALLTVNTPGFPIPRPEAVVAGGQFQALVAAGVPKVGPMIDWEAELEQWALRRLRDKALAALGLDNDGNGDGTEA